MSVGFLVIFCNLLPIISPIKFVGVLVLTIYRMLTGDVFRFFIVYIILLYGFSLALFALVKDTNPEPLGSLDMTPNEVSIPTL